MSLNKPDREAIIKAEEKAKRDNEIKFSQSGGSVYVNGTKYTDAHNAINKINKGN
ncbi:hypothetical protein ACTJJ0_22235 [Chitinophaga sp. 22321]|uniref:hypothetical protein n=1 Tax=Chitinophaga sp. 22321 TaxID=3453909 RepID=UPI003F852A88